MAEHGDGKMIPPPDVIEQEPEERLEAKMRADITERILREADLEGQIAKAMARIERPSGGALASGVRRLYERAPEMEWRIMSMRSSRSSQKPPCSGAECRHGASRRGTMPGSPGEHAEGEGLAGACRRRRPRLAPVGFPDD
jgi:hypothetical protein